MLLKDFKPYIFLRIFKEKDSRYNFNPSHKELIRNININKKSILVKMMRDYISAPEQTLLLDTAQIGYSVTIKNSILMKNRAILASSNKSNYYTNNYNSIKELESDGQTNKHVTISVPADSRGEFRVN